MIGDSATFYGQQRRRRSRQQMSYQQYLAGGVEDIVGAEVAASSADHGSSAARAIAIGVATGVLTLLINRWLESALR